MFRHKAQYVDNDSLGKCCNAVTGHLVNANISHCTLPKGIRNLNKIQPRVLVQVWRIYVFSICLETVSLYLNKVCRLIQNQARIVQNHEGEL